MLRALWFFIQVALIVTGALWLAGQDGMASLAWRDYTIQTPIGFFLLVLAFTAIFVFSLIRVLGSIFRLPSRMLGLTEEQRRGRGWRALTRGFVAVAAGHAGQATHYAKQTRRLLPQEQGLPLLLEAQAARLRGEEFQARQSFEELLKDKDASFFGVRGLLVSAMREGDNVRALSYAYKAQKAHPKQGWIAGIVYDLELKNRLWDKAEKTLKKAVKLGAVQPQQAQSDRIALSLAQAEIALESGDQKSADRFLEKAYKDNPVFVPTVERLGARLLERGKHKRLIKMIEKAWAENPHPALATLWDQLAPPVKGHDTTKVMRWYERLVAIKPESAEGQMAAAQAAMKNGLWGEARAYLTIAEQMAPSSRLYRLMAEVEEKTGQDPARVKELLEKANDAPRQKQWFCQQTGTIYARWLPVALPHGSFNTICWGEPVVSMQEKARLSSSRLSMNDLMIEAA